MGGWGKCLIIFLDIPDTETVWDFDIEALCVLTSKMFNGVNLGVILGEWGMGEMFINFFEILDPKYVWNCDIEALCVLTTEIFNGVTFRVIFGEDGENF